ncbi:uncharacterized protein [Amphiura filiformis]|uniref:uncharacterized protein n=1 Tax=Amphiura filiformis TaxID=82378 RepID=UPI003B2220C4
MGLQKSVSVTKGKGLHFMHFNTRSLLPKISELRCLISDAKPAAVAISETWLDESVPDNEINIQGYAVLRHDRDREGGGLITTATRITDTTSTCIDHILTNNPEKMCQSGTISIGLSDHLLIFCTRKAVRGQISQGNYTGMVMLDLQKAFDTVNHDILCNKLRAMGIESVDWFRSYLSERQQIVCVNKSNSKPMAITCGVPQGSVLGPLLFLCYVNDMPISVDCKLLLYADDSALLIDGKDPKEISSKLSKELESCQQWLIDNKLSLHLVRPRPFCLVHTGN